MQNARSLNPSIPAKDRLSMRLALLFFGTFLVVLILLLAWTLLATIGDRRQSAAVSDIAAPVIVIDPKIQTELAKALAFDPIPETAEVLNPFIDRAGIGGNVVVSTARAATQTAAAARSTQPGTDAAHGATSPQTRPSHFGPGPMMESYGLKERHDDWLARQKRGEFVGPESEVLAVEDMVPVGFASGGDRGDEVLLFSISLCRTFSFPAGTRFSDGWLNGFDQSEVVFTFQNGIRRKSYSNAEPCQPGVDSGPPNIASGP